MTTARVIPFPGPSDERRQRRGDRSPHSPAVSRAARRRQVSHKAQDWAWAQPVRGTRQHVLLALAKRAKPKTEIAVPSMPELAEMTGLTENTLRSHIRALEALGLIRADRSNGGRHKRSTYTLMVNATPCGETSTPQELQGRRDEETPQEMRPETPQEMSGGDVETPQLTKQNPSTDAPVVLRTKSGTRGGREAPAVADAAPEHSSDGLFDEPATPASVDRKRVKIAQAIAARYCELEPMSKYVQVLGIVRRPLENDRFSGEMVMAAVERIAKDERTLTLETLRIELVGFAPRSNPNPGRGNRVPLRDRLKAGGAA